MFKFALAAAAMLTATTATAEYIQFDDSAANRVTVTANGFEFQQLTVNGVSFDSQDFSDVSFDFAKGATLTFSGAYFRGTGATNGSTTYLFVTDADPTTVVAQLELNRTARNDEEQQVDGTYWGAGSGMTFMALGRGTTILLNRTDTGSFNRLPAFAGGRIVDGNFDLNAASAVPAVAAGVPEPASWALMIGGFGVVGGTVRRRKAAVRVAFA